MEKKQRPVVRQESGAQESETHVMIRDISTDLRQIRQELHDHIYDLENQLQQQQRHFYELNSQMSEKIDYLISQQNNNELFNCNASSGGGSSAFNFGEEEKEDMREQPGVLENEAIQHSMSRDEPGRRDEENEQRRTRRDQPGVLEKEAVQPSISREEPGRRKFGKTTEILKNRRHPQLRSTPKTSTDKDNTTHKPRAKSKTKKKSDQVQYYSSFADRQRGEPAAVNVGANAGLQNSNVACYSNAILQCLASCIHFSDFSPSVNHPEFPLNHAFESLMISMVEGEQKIIDPSSFTDVFMPLFQPQVGEVNADDQQGMYYDFA